MKLVFDIPDDLYELTVDAYADDYSVYVVNDKSEAEKNPLTREQHAHKRILERLSLGVAAKAAIRAQEAVIQKIKTITSNVQISEAVDVASPSNN